MTNDEESELRAKMRSSLRDAADMAREIDTATDEFLYEACRSWNFDLDPAEDEGRVTLTDIDKARERYESDLESRAADLEYEDEDEEGEESE